MFTEGKIKSYITERGFGFIAIEGESKDLFFHIKDFPNKSVEPKIGEKLKFRIVEEGGKLKADNIVRLDVKIESVTHTPQSRARVNQQYKRQSSRQEQKGGGFNFINLIVGFVIVGIFGAVFIPLISGIYQRETLRRQSAQATNIVQVVDNTKISNTQIFTCDGRKHCSEMHSYDEAVFFINNCPGTLMDGDSDGEPCEGQFKNRW
ncbi:cold shock domain-containing protein [Acinetobacter sp. ANC 5380]|jgi:cold shock CspA family protein|uniref:Cold shock domain-containing protein n=1 Tax=Acinetobacter terrae TaxID=2731247 RepID=A0A7Y2WCM7_9GAMM|nr:cold shock domain-containing protein [Acinetobacter terrae]NNH78963.1 cold shock domain-containing protein [Acinetobacter terrae]